jgi:hypothetical protein
MSSIFKDCGCGCAGSKQREKFTASVMSALLFFIIANPETFTIVRRVLGNWVASPTGNPTVLGLVLHAFIFMLIVWAIMNIKREKEEGSMEPPKKAEESKSFMDMMPKMPSMSGPPEPVPETAAPKPTTLPQAPAMSQPMFEPETANMVPQKSPEAISTSPMDVAKPNDGTMAKIKGMFGGSDDNSSLASAPPPAVYGSNWRQCACGDGTQVMILK